MEGLGQVAILKDGNPGGADADARMIGRFKVEAGNSHKGEPWIISIKP
jgi:hypothetical protein